MSMPTVRTGYRKTHRKPLREARSPVPVENLMTRVEFDEWLVRYNPYGWYLAHKFHARREYVEVAEVHAAVLLGFCEAFTRFDRSLGFRFTTYAAYYGKKCARECVRDAHNQGFHIPGKDDLGKTRWLECRPRSIDIRLDHLPVKRGRYLRETIPDRAGAEEELAFPVDFWDRLRTYLPVERLCRILELRFRHGWSLTAIGEELGVTRERIRQLEGVALRCLRGFPELMAGIEGLDTTHFLPETRGTVRT